MKKEKRLFSILAVFLLLPCFIFGQSHDLVVDDFMSTGKFLQDVIWGDTTAAGARADLERVYVLKRGGVYYLSVSFENRTAKTGNWPLRIKAQDGNGAKPIIYAYRQTNGSYAGQMFQAYNDINFDGIAITGWAEGLEDFDRYPNHIINMNAAGFSLILNNCVLNGGNQTLLRTGAQTKYVRITNSILANSGNLKSTNIGNGRAIDFRDVGLDSVYIENSSFLNFTDRVFRHYNAHTPINKFYLNHCTFLNILGEHGSIALGRIQGDVTINNNLFLNPLALGNDSTAYQGTDSRMPEFAYTEELGANGQPVMTLVGSVPNDTSYINWEIKNNYYANSADLKAVWAKYEPANLGVMVPLTNHINGKLGSAAANAFKELSSIDFTNSPASPAAFVDWFLTPLDQGGAGRSKNNGTFTLAVDMDRKNTEYYLNTIDLAYPQTSEAYTGAVNGFPAGDLNWFPDKKAQWEQGTSVEKTDVIPTAFALEQNYPNPFNPATIITYNVPMAGKVKLEVFDILGRNVATLIDQEQEVGQYKVDFDGSKLSTGVYVYRLSSQGVQLTKKMMLMK